MKTILSIILLVFSFASFAQQDTLLWSDEFNGTGPPDPANWSYDLGTNNGWGNQEIQIYTNSTQNSYQENGSLFIKALKSYTTWTSARIITRNKVSFTYGRVVFRAKLPAGSGTWPALWLLGQNLSTAGWPACGEIDVMEHAGKNPGIVHSALHSSSSSGNTVNTKTTTVANFNTEFHLYEARWTPEKIEFSVDSNLFYTYNPAVKNESTWPFHRPFFLIMNIAMGGTFGSDPQYETNGLKNGIDPSLYYAIMEIDYVRVYKFSYPASIGEPGDINKKNGTGSLFFSPNPANGKIHIQLMPGKEAKGTLYDIVGNDVLHFQASDVSPEIDISSLAKGIYLISIESEGIYKTNKLVVN